MKLFHSAVLDYSDKPIKMTPKRVDLASVKDDVVYCPVNKGFMYLYCKAEYFIVNSGRMSFNDESWKIRKVFTNKDIAQHNKDSWDVSFLSQYHLDIFLPKRLWSADSKDVHNLVSKSFDNDASCGHDYDCCGCLSMEMSHKSVRVSRKCIRVEVSLSRGY